MSREAGFEDPVEELIRRARGGEEAAREELFRRCRRVLDKWASRRLAKSRPGVARVSDVAQDAALRAFQKFETFHGQTEAEWMTWLRSVLQSCTEQAFRDAGRKKRDDSRAVPLDSSLELSAPQPSPSEEISVKEQWREILVHISRLPTEQKEAIADHFLKGLPTSEVAQRMGKSQDAVRGLLQRGIVALQSHLASRAVAEAHESSASASGDEAKAAFLVYLRRRDAGEAVDREAFVAEHPACAEELREMLDWSERLRALRLASPTQ